MICYSVLWVTLYSSLSSGNYFSTWLSCVTLFALVMYLMLPYAFVTIIFLIIKKITPKSFLISPFQRELFIHENLKLSGMSTRSTTLSCLSWDMWLNIFVGILFRGIRCQRPVFLYLRVLEEGWKRVAAMSRSGCQDIHAF